MKHAAVEAELSLSALVADALRHYRASRPTPDWGGTGDGRRDDDR